MAIAVHAARRGRVARGERAVVIGAGGIGAFLVFAAAAWGAEVVVADLDAGARWRPPSALGAARALGAGDDGARARRRVRGVGERPQGLAQALALAPRGGRVVVVGIQKAPPAVDMRGASRSTSWS